jgi:phosphate transport system substrate-binding protein
MRYSSPSRFRSSHSWLLRAFTVFILFASAAVHAQTIKIAGQDTLILVGQRWKQLLAIDAPRLASGVVVEGGNPGIGALTSRSADILQTRELLSTSAAFRVPVAVEAIVVYVNDANPVRELSLADLKAIYTGSITNWKQLGGPDQRIELYAGESTTGIQDYFRQAVLNGDESFYVGKASTKSLLETIASRPNAIGYASFGGMLGVHAVSIRKTAHMPAIEPNTANIRTVQYPISRYVYWYMLRGGNPLALQLSKWIFSAHGQLVADAVGFFPLLPDDRKMSLAKLGIK